jgi:hypothetical protein
MATIKKTISKKNTKAVVKFTIKRNTNNLLSAQEHSMSEDVKAFRKIAYKMNVTDSIEINNEQCRKIRNFLRFRKLTGFFKARYISKSNDIIAFYCIKKVSKTQLL